MPILSHTNKSKCSLTVYSLCPPLDWWWHRSIRHRSRVGTGLFPDKVGSQIRSFGNCVRNVMDSACMCLLMCVTLCMRVLQSYSVPRSCEWDGPRYRSERSMCYDLPALLMKYKCTSFSGKGTSANTGLSKLTRGGRIWFRGLHVQTPQAYPLHYRQSGMIHRRTNTGIVSLVFFFWLMQWFPLNRVIEFTQNG